jgi:sulfhydrogenase subunit gamma (sulfur reductase)
MEGKHILFIAGGIGYVPLRSLINLTLKHPDKYKKISILYGCKTPGDQMFKDELQYISSLGGNIELLETVDIPDDKWLKQSGVITELIPMSKFDHLNTIAIICGPPVMYKFVIQTLKRNKLTTDNMYVSLERRMKCGVGKCGHCQIEDLYVCQCGPVFRFSDIEDKEEAL